MAAVGDQGGLAFHDEIELAGRDAQRAARVTGQVLALAGVLPVSNQQEPSAHSAPMPVTCGLPSGLIVASQQVCRSGPPVPGAWLRPAASRASIGAQSSSGEWYKSARLVASMANETPRNASIHRRVRGAVPEGAGPLVAGSDPILVQAGQAAGSGRSVGGADFHRDGVVRERLGQRVGAVNAVPRGGAEDGGEMAFHHAQHVRRR